VTHAEKLDEASGYFFLSGLVLSKFQIVPVALVSSIFKLISLTLYLIGYILWFIASHLHPDHKINKTKWYNFIQLKEQNRLSAILGLIATVLSFAAIVVPVMFPPACWIYLVANIIWTIGAYNKLKNPPPHETTYSHTRQKEFLFYAFTATMISLITAIAATFILVFPIMAIPITIASILICAVLGVHALEHWLNYRYGTHEPTPIPGTYHQVGDKLGLKTSHEHTYSPAPHPGKDLLNKRKQKKISTESVELTEDFNMDNKTESIPSFCSFL